MSNLTDFFPSTGGSSDITDPKLMPRLATGPIGGARYIKYTNGAVNNDNTTPFWEAFSGVAMSEEMSMLTLSATFNTYETVLDVSSSTNGGYLNYILGSYINGGQTETYKITVDGVATEIVRAPPSGSQYQSSILGWVAPGYGLDGTTTRVAGSMGEQAAKTSTYNQPTSNTVYTNTVNGFIYVYGNAYTLPNSPWAYPNLRFKETLKVEIKRSGRYTSSNTYNYTAVRHKLI